MKEIWVLLGPDEQDNRAALEVLDQLGGVKLRIVGDTACLAKYVDLPYIQTEKKDRYYGLESIREFVTDELGHSNHNH